MNFNPKNWFEFLSHYMPRSVAWVLTIVIILVVSYGSFEGIKQYGLSQISISTNLDSVKTNNSPVSTASTSAKQLSCTQSDFSDLKTRWDTVSYNKLQDGYLCPRGSVSYWAPEIWLIEEIPVNFLSANLKAEVRPDNNSNNNVSPGLIISLGRDPRLFRFLINDGGDQLVAFERIIFGSSGVEFSRLAPAKELDDPIQPGTSISVTANALLSGGNTAIFVFNVEYISAVSHDREEDEFRYDVFLPDPRPSDDGSNTKFGFSVFKGNCIRPLIFKACW